jgi:hypothetical protein
MRRQKRRPHCSARRAEKQNCGPQCVTAKAGGDAEIYGNVADALLWCAHIPAMSFSRSQRFLYDP